jgi:DNA repair protein RAD57
MDKVYSILCADLEMQEHILYYQVEVAVKRYGVGLVVLDSVAANFRAEFERGGGEAVNMAKRSADLQRLGQFLSNLARDHNIAIAVANQVSDRFTSPMPPSSTSIILALDHQQRWFTGWGDTSTRDSPGFLSPKTPSLGLIWANCLSARVSLIKEPVYGTEEGEEAEKELLRWRRWMKVVFAPWVEGGVGREVEFVITEEGVTGVERVEFAD